MPANNTTSLDEAAFELTRVFNAPRELVFKVWTEPDHLSQWWGPTGFELGVAKMDPRPGGVFHYSMRSPEGFEMWGRIVYLEIDAPEKLVFTTSFSDADGNITRHPSSETWPLVVESTLVFTEQDGKTTIAMRGIPVDATEEEVRTFLEGHSSMQQGFGGTFAQLEAYLERVQA
ncbi:SRPBCC family protein [Paenibacillus sp. MMS18-CY102]|uniref:SRPBCC family protein n=1 Tax=Paenibacillus sp. MMS18-CY102 TaxID=2682849 RepID=UPI001365A099|nr:SRPBCC domain-containing protein [Paenibacillus sp. MMS18-CY102]MWC27141.1 SRPBCC domain-containing protein [Paenibacillus sp. MMS18-CY102]